MSSPSLAPETEAPDALAPPPRHPRFPLIDGLRAIAALTVLGVHVAVFAPLGDSFGSRLLLHLNLGVTIFFVISGFLLYRPLIAHRAAGPAAPNFGRYAWRRALRILPAYWLVLSVLTLLPGVVGVSGGDWLAQYSLLHAFSFAAGPDACVRLVTECGLAQTWSLAVELTFYVVLPFFFLLSERLSRNRRGWPARELSALGLLAAGSIALQLATFAPRPTTLVSGSLLGFLLWFALGMGLAVVSVAWDGGDRRPAALRAVANRPGLAWLAALAAYVALCLILPASPFLFERGQQIGVHISFGLIALLLMLPAVFAGEGGAGVPGRILGHRWMAWLGLISYGIFLWHYVVAVELGFPGEDLGFLPLLALTLTISIACATASYYGLERPLLKLKNRRPGRDRRDRPRTTILPGP